MLIQILTIPSNSKLHNLLSLVAKDLKIAPSPEMSESSLLLQHQKLILEHFGHKNTVVLPEDVIQHLLLRVCTLTFLYLSTKFSRFSRQVIPKNTQNWFPFYLSSQPIPLNLHST